MSPEPHESSTDRESPESNTTPSVWERRNEPLRPRTPPHAGGPVIVAVLFVTVLAMTAALYFLIQAARV